MCTFLVLTRQVSHLVKIGNEILMYLRAQKKFNNDVYLQAVLGVDREGNAVQIADKLAVNEDPIDYQVATKMHIVEMNGAMGQVLHGREKEVIEMRYGLAGKDELTQREISKILKISRSYVSRIEKKALTKLRAFIERFC